MTNSTNISDGARRFLWITWAASAAVAFSIVYTILEHIYRDNFSFTFRKTSFLLVVTAAISPLVRWLWFRFTAERLKDFSLRSKILLHAGALCISGLLLFVVPVANPISWADCFAIAFVVLIVGTWLISRPALLFDPKVSGWAWLGYALPLWLAWGHYWWAFWPGLISHDSVFMWVEATTGRYKQDHPPLYTFCIKIASIVWNSPACLVLVQIILLSLAISGSLVWLRRHGMPRWLALLAVCIFAFFPTNGMMVISIWKDVLYSIALLALIMAVLKIVQTEGEWIKTPLSWFCLAIPSIVVFLARHNGFPVVIAVFAGIFFAYRRRWKPILAAFVLSAVGIGIVRGPIYSIAGVPPINYWFKSCPFVHNIAAHVASKTPLEPEERELLDKILPLEDDAWKYNPACLEPIIRDKNFHSEVVNEEKNYAQLHKMFFSLAIRRPSVTLEHLLKSSRQIWQIKYSEIILPAVIFEKNVAKRYDPYLVRKPQNEVTFEFQPMDHIPLATKISYHHSLHWLFWRPALFMYLFFAGCIVAALRSQNAKYLLVALPIFVQTGMMMSLSFSCDFRFHWGTYLTGILLSGYLLLAIPRRKATPTLQKIAAAA